MDESAVRKIVEDNIDRLKANLGLKDWNIIIDYGSLADDMMKGVCDALINQQEALIIIDSAVIQDDKEVIEVLTHELLHCILATFHTYKFAVNCFLTEKERSAINVIFCRAEEEVVCNFIRILKEKNENETM